ncbi:acyltransferase family protein [Dermabacteraceae bacterium P13147]
MGVENSVRRSGRLEALDAVRLVAALMVVSFHWTFNGIVNGKIANMPITRLSEVTRYGFWGVTLFFLISGFVISRSVQGKSVRAYVVSRATRLYPAFWVSVLITGIVAMFVQARGMEVSLGKILVNLTMIPSVFGVGFVDGAYWTLEYELFFYAVVLLVMLFVGERFLVPLMAVWAVAAALATFSGYGSAFFVLARPFPAFAGGALIASLVDNPRGKWWRHVALVAAWLTTVRTEVSYSHQLEAFSQRNYSSLVVAALITSFFVFLLLHVFPAVRSLRIPGARTAGALTYPVYLLHAHLGYMALAAWGSRENAIWLYPLLLLGLLALAYLLHRIVEVDMKAQWRKFFEGTVGVLAERLDSTVQRFGPVRRLREGKTQ